MSSRSAFASLFSPALPVSWLVYFQLAVLPTIACLSTSSTDTTPAAAVAQDPPIRDARRQIASVAFAAASALPADPHIKTRTRLQGQVVDACLRQGQLALAAEFCDRADGWQLGICCADLGYELAQRGQRDDAVRWLERAAKAADAVVQDANAQAWRRDRVRARIARAYFALGDRERAAEFGRGLVDHEAARALADVAATVTDAEREAFVADLDRRIAGGEFEQVRAALAACAVLYDRCFADAEVRAAQAHRVETAYDRLPVLARLEGMESLAAAALRHGDPAEAMRLVEAMQQRYAIATWLPGDRLVRIARLAALRGRAGGVAQARKDLDAAMAQFEQDRKQIVDIDRADALWPAAEAYDALGDADAARRVYGMALDEAVVNPNSRPRAEDLVAVCASLLAANCEADAALLERIEAVRADLHAPW